MTSRPLLAAVAALIFSCTTFAEDGYDLWLRYAAIEPANLGHFSHIVAPTQGSDIAAATESELLRVLVRGVPGKAGRHPDLGGRHRTRLRQPDGDHRVDRLEPVLGALERDEFPKAPPPARPLIRGVATRSG